MDRNGYDLSSMVETFLATGWEFRRSSPSLSLPKGRGDTWMQARVPGHVHDDLIRHRLIEDPFYRMNERECQWVDQEDWFYRCRFSWAPAVGMPRKVLRFEGLDTVCSIFLNGDTIAESDNMFLPFEVDVAEVLRVGENELLIEFSSAVWIAEERKARYLAQEGIDPSVFTFYDRSFVRKAQYMFGWDWGPRLVSCGVWKPVVLLEYESRITDVWARPRYVDGNWEVEVSWEGENVDRPVFFCRDSGVNAESRADGTLLVSIENPQLWWPHGEGGRPHRYQCGLQHSNQQMEFAFGLRTVELLREPDKWGESFEFVVNGRRVFCRGANWIPSHSFPSLARPGYGHSGRSVGLFMGCNMVRVWGGGLYESKTFYEMMDRDGIMVWQDFPFACAYYPEDEATLASVEKEARANIKRLRNHPSLVLWCGNNENQPMHEQRWGGAKSPGRFYGEKIYDELLPRVLRSEDPDRPYVSGSPSGKVEGKDSNMDGVGDSHYWEVWHGKGDWKHYEESTSRFCSEFGFASSPSVYTWSKTLAPEDWKFDSEAVKWHDKTLKGYDKYISFIEMHYPKIETLEDLVYYSQLNQRDALRHGIEHFLRSDFCRGTLIWQLNDCWPVQSWSVVDSFGRMKPAFYEIARMYQSIATGIRVTGGEFEFWITNNSLEPFSFLGKQSAGVYKFDGTPISTIDLSGVDAIEPSTSRMVGTLQSGDETKSSFALFLLGQFSCVRFAVEPKEIVLPCEKLLIQVDASMLVVGPAKSCLFDLWIYDPDDFGNVTPVVSDITAFIAPSSSAIETPTFSAELQHEPKRLVARSLTGFHEVEIIRSPM